MVALPKAHVVVGANNVVHVHVAGEALYHLESLQALTADILGRFGCRACHSGVQILYQQAEQEFTVGG